MEAKAFRMLAARLNYMSRDNVWLQFQAKEICWVMSRPRRSDFIKIKRVVRFLKGIGEVKLFYEWQNEDEARKITVHVDSDWAGCKETRKSTSGGVLKSGKARGADLVNDAGDGSHFERRGGVDRYVRGCNSWGRHANCDD